MEIQKLFAHVVVWESFAKGKSILLFNTTQDGKGLDCQHHGRHKEAGFRNLTEAIDATTAPGRMMMQMVGAFAEFERILS